MPLALTFTSGESLYAVPFEKIDAIIAPQMTTALPINIRMIKGIFPYRGNIVILYSLDSILGSEEDRKPEGYVVFSDKSAIQVTRCESFIQYDFLAIKEIPPIGGGLINTIIEIEEKMIGLIDLDFLKQKVQQELRQNSESLRQEALWHCGFSL